MHTEEYYLIKNTNVNSEKIEIPFLNKKELNIIQEHIEFTRHFQEIDQLFHVYKVNLENLLINYELTNNDTFYRKNIFFKEKDDSIIINALVINYISSAKTFTQATENFVRTKLGDDLLSEYKKKCLSKIYDERFSYRLLIRLRDFSQHEHLPVYIYEGNKCCFNIEQIVNTPHFDLNTTLKEEMKSIILKINEEYGDNARIVFTRSIAEFNISIIEIYNYFVNGILIKLKELERSFNSLVKNRPDIIYKSEDALNGFILYAITDGNLHCINPKENSVEMVKSIKSNIKIELKDAKKEFKNVFKTKI